MSNMRKVDALPCPVCGASPPLIGDGTTVFQDGHEPEAEEIDVSTNMQREVHCFLFFRCRRCKARWPEDVKRVVYA